jgi:undecaprenyl-diphosphatase
MNEASYSFPSGHAMINSALYSMLILLIFKYVKRRRIKYSLSSLCIILAAAIGYSRIYLGVHYAGDVLGGWLIGFSLAVMIFFIWDSLPQSQKKSDA